MTAKNIEVEIRGPLSLAEYKKFNSFLLKNGEFRQKKERVLIDYSSGIEDRKKDIRIRETNGIPEIIIKLGSWGGVEQREEISLSVENDKFETLVRVFGELGFTKGVLCVRNAEVFDYKNIEFALIKVPNHSYFFEAEILTDPEKTTEAELKIKKVCEELDLSIFSKEEFFSYVQRLNKEANIMFDYEKYQRGYFEEKKYLDKKN